MSSKEKTTPAHNLTIPPLDDQSQPYFALLFKPPDKIEIILADDDTIAAIRSACSTSCVTDNNCIQSSSFGEDGSYQIKFRDAVFGSGSRLETAIFARRIALNILSSVYAIGWDFILSSSLSLEENYSTWFFRRRRRRVITTTTRDNDAPPPSMLCLSLSSKDCLHLIGEESADHHQSSTNKIDDIQSPMNSILHLAVQKSYRYGIQHERRVGGLCYEIKLRGNPWSTTSVEHELEARRMLLEIIRQFHARSYRLYATGNLKGTADCLFFAAYQHQATAQEKFCMISLNGNDQLHLIDCPRAVIDETRRLITGGESWPAGLRNETELGGRVVEEDRCTWEFQMRGFPWSTAGATAINCRLFLSDLFEALLQQFGWRVHASLDISRKINDKSAFLLRCSCQPAAAAARLSHFCISLNEGNKMRLIVNNKNKEHPLLMDTTKRILRHAIVAGWPPNIQREDDFHGSHEFKLKGDPWSAYCGSYRCLSRAMMCRVMAEFYANGYSVIASADVSVSYDTSGIKSNATGGMPYPLDVQTWFIVQNSTPQTAGDQAAGTPSEPPRFDHHNEPPPSYDDAVK